MSSPEPLLLHGPRVDVRRIRAGDAVAHSAALTRSAARIGQWNPVDLDGFAMLLAAQSAARHTFMVLDRETGDLAATINLTNVVRGRMCSAALGYDAYDPWQGTGRTAEGLRLVLAHAFDAESDGGLGLHRVEAVVQPGNIRSATLLRGLGLWPEGRSRALLRVPCPDDGPEQPEGWRDHDRYAVTADRWPGPPYPVEPSDRLVVWVTGDAETDGTTVLARALSAELRLPLLAEGALLDRLAAVLADAASGAVVDAAWHSGADGRAVAGLRQAGVDPATVVEVRCGSSGRLGLGRVVRVDRAERSTPLTRRDLVVLALTVRAAAG